MVATVDFKHVFKYPVDVVAKTHFNKYPCQQEKFVQKVITVEHKQDFQHGLDYRKRIAVCTNVIPSVLRTFKILNEDNFLLEEEAWLRWRKPEFRLRSCNMTWAKYAKVWEESVFTPAPDNPKWTLLQQHGEVEIGSLGPFGRVLELFAQRFLETGVRRGVQIMEDQLKKTDKS